MLHDLLVQVAYLNSVISRLKPILVNGLNPGVSVVRMTRKMTSAQVVETSVTNNSSFQNYPRPDDHTICLAFFSDFKLYYFEFLAI